MAGGQRVSKQRGGAALMKADKQVRDDLIYLTRLGGAKLKEIQNAFNLSKPTVQNAIRNARNGRIGAIARDLVLTRLLPRAIATLETEMDAGGERAVDVALHLFEKMQLATPVTPEGTQVVEEFEAFRRKVITTVEAPHARGVEPDTFDAEVVRDERFEGNLLAFGNPSLLDPGSGGVEPPDQGEGWGVGGDVSGDPASGNDHRHNPGGRHLQDASGAAQIHRAGVEGQGPAEVEDVGDGLEAHADGFR